MKNKNYCCAHDFSYFAPILFRISLKFVSFPRKNEFIKTPSRLHACAQTKLFFFSSSKKKCKDFLARSASWVISQRDKRARRDSRTKGESDDIPHVLRVLGLNVGYQSFLCYFRVIAVTLRTHSLPKNKYKILFLCFRVKNAVPKEPFFLSFFLT